MLKYFPSAKSRYGVEGDAEFAPEEVIPAKMSPVAAT
jgi:hypothetical protein